MSVLVVTREIGDLTNRDLISYIYDIRMAEAMEVSTLQGRQSATDDERLVQMLKALGNPVRFRIMQTLAERQMCITQEIVETTPLAQSTVSQHLKVLREAGLIEGETRRAGDLLLPQRDGRALAEGADRGLAAGMLRAGQRVAPAEIKPVSIGGEPDSTRDCCG